MSAAISKNPMTRVMGLRDFRLLFAGAATSLLGDQFTMIATPWLVLQLTNDPAALGIVLALQGIPRAVFMLFGGALTDHLSPRLVMLIANVTRFFLTAVMAFLVLTGAVQIWMLYFFSLAFGIAAGFAIPAENSIVPLLVKADDLQAGNSIIMGVTQLAGFVGPTIAGILIGRYTDSLTGVAWAFALDAFTFVVSAVTLQLIRGGKAQSSSEGTEKESVWASIAAGVRYLWKDSPLRLMLMIHLTINFMMVGPLMVGIPVLANDRLPEGAAAFGLLMSAFAGGNLAGYLIAGSLPKPGGGSLRWIMVGLVAVFGVVIGALGFVPSTWVDFGLLLVMGLGNGYMSIILMTWMQTRTPKEMMGRTMSILVLSSSGLVPISQALAGLLSKSNLTLMFAIPGALVVLVSAWMILQPDLKRLTMSMAEGSPTTAEAMVEA
jgi:MFS family permease